MVNTLVNVILALLAVAFIAYPLLAPPRAEEEDFELPEDLDELYRRKESAYSAIKELEFDFRTGKLSEGDYRELETRYRADALEILGAIEETEGAGQETQRSGGKKSAAKKGATGRREVRAEATPRATASNPYACGSCGRVNPEGSLFCAACGSELEASEMSDATLTGDPENAGDSEPVCDDCGAWVDPDNRFCASCGAEVHV